MRLQSVRAVNFTAHTALGTWALQALEDALAEGDLGALREYLDQLQQALSAGARAVDAGVGAADAGELRCPAPRLRAGLPGSPHSTALRVRLRFCQCATTLLRAQLTRPCRARAGPAAGGGVGGGAPLQVPALLQNLLGPLAQGPLAQAAAVLAEAAHDAGEEEEEEDGEGGAPARPVARCWPARLCRWLCSPAMSVGL